MTPATPAGPQRLRLELADLSPSQFEDLVYDLVTRGWPDARKVAIPDGGADVWVPSEGRVFQCKHFVGDIHLGHCKKSLEDAIKNFDPKQVTFVFPKQLNRRLWAQVDSQLVEPAGDVRVSVWTLHDLSDRLAQSPDLRERHLGSVQPSIGNRIAEPTALREPLLIYLQKLTTRLAELPDYYPAGFEFDEIRQRVRVSTHRLKAEDTDEIRGGAGGGRSRLARAVRDFDRRYEHRTEAVYDDTLSDPVKDWEEVRDEATRAVLLADPGFGKTWLLRAEGLRLGRASIRLLELGREVDETPLPLLARLDGLAAELEAGHPVAEALARAALRPLMDVTASEAGALVEFVATQTRQPSTTLLLGRAGRGPRNQASNCRGSGVTSDC